MNPDRIGLKELEPTERLPIKLRNELQRFVLEQYGFNDVQALVWLKDNNKRISEIIDENEMIKAEARAGNLEYAAGMVREQLDEQDVVSNEK